MNDSMQNVEVWRTVPGHPDYDVSSRGRVRSRKGRRYTHIPVVPVILSCGPDPAGYPRTTIDRKHYNVHRLVAAAFHGPCPEGMEVDHINSVRHDNRPENLRYVTRQENLVDRKFHNVEVCINGHQMSGHNVYIRPSNGRRECRACGKVRSKRMRTADRECAYPDCAKTAFCRMSTTAPICEMHYQRERKVEKLAAAVSGTDRAEQGATRPQETSMQVDDGYGDERWEGVDPHATYLRNLPVEPIPEWMQTAVSGTDRAEQ